MLVSLAVLSVALAVVGVVFTITTKAASQSAAYSEANNWVRQFTQQIEEDLRYCDPAHSLMVIVGRTQAAALTPDDLAAGKHYRVLIGNQSLVPPDYDPEYADGVDPQYSDPRADILMLFTNRPTTSVAPVPNPDPSTEQFAFAAAGGVKFSPVRVVYGHAALADPVWTGTSYRFPLSTENNLLHHIETDGALSPIPASRWHLARVATIVTDSGFAGLLKNTQFSATACWNAAEGSWYSESSTYAPSAQRMPGDAAWLSYAFLLETLGPSATNWYGLPTPVWPALWQPYALCYAGNTQATINSLVYATGTAAPTDPAEPHHVATVLNGVPAELAGNMAVHMLPGCVWFQVEFLMPEDPCNSAGYSLIGPALTPPRPSHSDVARWTTPFSAVPGEARTYVFVPDTPENRELVAKQVDPATGQPIGRLADFGRLDQTLGNDSNHPETVVSNRVIRMWPYALRITVRVYDPNGRLDEPIVRTIVHRFE